MTLTYQWNALNYRRRVRIDFTWWRRIPKQKFLFFEVLNKVKSCWSMTLHICRRRAVKVFSTWNVNGGAVCAAKERVHNSRYRKKSKNIDNRWVNYFWNLSGSEWWGEEMRAAIFHLNQRNFFRALVAEAVKFNNEIDRSVARRHSKNINSSSLFTSAWYIYTKCQTRLAADNSKSQ